MDEQRPRGPADTRCPLWRKPMSQVCDSCGWWTKLQFQHPQTGETVSKWDCSINWAVIANVETGHRTNQMANVFEDVRNAVVAALDRLTGTLRIAPSARDDTRRIDHEDHHR